MAKTNRCLFHTLTSAVLLARPHQRMQQGGLLPALQHSLSSVSSLISVPPAATHRRHVSSSSTTTTSSSPSGEPYDVCVVGAGMVGAALVALLRECTTLTTAAAGAAASVAVSLKHVCVCPLCLKHPTKCHAKVLTCCCAVSCCSQVPTP